MVSNPAKINQEIDGSPALKNYTSNSDDTDNFANLKLRIKSINGEEEMDTSRPLHGDTMPERHLQIVVEGTDT